MDIYEYQRLAMRTAKEQGDRENLVNAALGIAGEGGEFADMVKKLQYHGHALDRHEAAKELGDILWYLALACHALGVELEDVAKNNIEKLKRRYPDGFSPQDSINREG